jgi:hypothetical protein
MGELTKSEKSELERCEKAVQNGFYAMGAALLIIRDKHLYRADYPTFEEYCDRRWDLKQSRAYQMIESAKIVDGVADESSTNGGTLPSNERQTRALAEVEPDRRKEVWKETVQDTNGKPTSAAIAKKAEQIGALKPNRNKAPDAGHRTQQAAAQRAAVSSFEPDVDGFMEDFDILAAPEIDFEEALSAIQSLMEWLEAKKFSGDRVTNRWVARNLHSILCALEA